jgi:hypothetical protein
MCDVIGKWEIVVYEDNTAVWQGRFEFFKNYETKNSLGMLGKWSIKNNEVYIDWGQGRFDTFSLPFHNEATGRSWRSDKRVLKAKRIEP